MLSLLWITWWALAALREWRTHQAEQRLELEAGPPALSRAA